MARAPASRRRCVVTTEYGKNLPLTSRVLPLLLLLTEDDRAALDWVGCPFDAQPDEVVRALLQHVLHETTHLYRWGIEAEELGLVI